MSRIALLFSGQGAQTLGMGADLPQVVRRFEEADEILGRPLSRVVSDGPLEDLTRTANCQPALYVHGLGCLDALMQALPDLAFEACAGLSLGEFTAHAAAGTFSFENGLRLVERRGSFMDDACMATNGAMAALIGAEHGKALALASECNVDIANLNSPGQIVISGDRTRVEAACGLAKEYGIRKAVPLTVAGAYHSRLMKSAQDRLAEEVGKTEIRQPGKVVVSNVTARPVSEPTEIAKALVDQVTGTVRWSESIEYLLDQGVDCFLELGPGAVLAGLVGRIRKETRVYSIADAASLATAVASLRAQE